MEMKKRIIKGCAWALALVTAVSLLAVRQDTAYGAAAVDVEKDDCSITFSLPKNGDLPNGQVKEEYAQYYEEMSVWLAKNKLKVELYRVADITVNGRYEAIGAFSELGGEFKYQKTDDGTIVFPTEGAEGDQKVETSGGLAAVSSTTTADEWSIMAEKAFSLKGNGTPTKTEEIGNGSTMTIGSLETGMYLVWVEPVKSELYEYSFVPFLISLPNNYFYAQTGGTGNDTWQYQTQVGLKPERKERYASLEITKTLSDFNTTLGNAMFVFDVTAVNGGEVVYSGVAELNFDGPGTKSVLIGPEKKEGVNVVVGKIPAGSTVRVEERYGGAAYEVVGDAVQTVSDIKAVEENSDAPSDSVTFTNRYNGSVNGGAGVVNHFEYSEENDNWLAPVQQFVPERTEGGNP